MKIKRKFVFSCSNIKNTKSQSANRTSTQCILRLRSCSARLIARHHNKNATSGSASLCTNNGEGIVPSLAPAVILQTLKVDQSFP